MCDHDPQQSFQLRPSGKPSFDAIPLWRGSRRRRLWELSRDSHCPVIGVCLPLALLRQLVNKALGGQSEADDFALHVGAVSACTTRNRISELLQDELDRRYMVIVRRYRSAKQAGDVAALWRQAVMQGDVTGAFWAALTHPRCDSALEDMLCQDMHMLQHQAGATTRVERNQFDEITREHGVLTRELAKAQERCTRVLAERSRDIERLSAEVTHLRGVVLGKDSSIASLREEIAGLRATVPELEARVQLKRKVAVMAERLQDQDGQIAALRQELEAARAALAVPRTEPAAVAPAVATFPVTVYLRGQTVLCVGGRSGNVAEYRGVVEQVGARFAHHDGGMEDNVGQLDASLAAADMVICQTGCISHNAYWRVKDHCKRMGKRCVFVDNPSVSSLSRGLSDLGQRRACPAA